MFSFQVNSASFSAALFLHIPIIHKTVEIRFHKHVLNPTYYTVHNDFVVPTKDYLNEVLSEEMV